MSILPEMKKVLKGVGFRLIDAAAPVLSRDRGVEMRMARKILVLAGGGIGDLIGVLPAVESLRANFPRASITLLAAPSSSIVLELYPKRGIIDEIMDYEPEGRHRGMAAKIALSLSLRRKGVDLSYAPGRGEGMREEMVMSYLTGAYSRLGFRQARAGSLHTCSVELRDDLPIMRQNLGILRAAGMDVGTDGVDLVVPASGLKGASSLLDTWGVARSEPFIIIHPGASWKGALRCWPLRKYMELMRVLVREEGRKIIVTGGSAEASMAEEVSREFKGEMGVINAIGKTTLLQMAALMSLSSLFIGNDSGPLHIAQALGVPSVAIFGFTSAAQVVWRKDLCVVVEPSGVTPRYLHQYDYRTAPEDEALLDLVSVAEVLAGVRRAASAMI